MTHSSRSCRLTWCHILALLAITGMAVPVAAQVSSAVTVPVPGIDTFHPVTTTIACGSNARPEAMPTLRTAGFVSIVSFSEDSEPGYDRPALQRAASTAGLRYVSIPFNREHPDPAAAERFLAVMAAPDALPAYVSCHSGQRAAAMWAIKRVRQDGWKTADAMTEAESLGLTRPELKRFVVQFLERR